MTDKICWNCRFFEADDTQGTYSGKCRRYAPSGVDANGYTTDFTRNSHLVQMGRVDEGIMTSIDSPVITYITQGVQVLPTAGGAGFAGDNCFPFVIGRGHRLAKMTVQSLLMNVGAATVGSSPVFKIGIYAIEQSTDTLIHTIEVPIPPANLGIAGNLTPNMFAFEYSLPIPWPPSSFPDAQMWAAKFILESGDSNVVGEIDNTIVAAELDYYGTAENAIIAFPWIIAGNTEWCGDFQKNSGEIPVLP